MTAGGATRANDPAHQDPVSADFSHGFGPVSDHSARVLILGSLPGRRSIADGEYYAQPRNAFWRIMGELFGAGPDLDYAQRLDRLKSAGIALWDVLAAGQRPGSLDSAIVRASVVVNDIDEFLGRHPHVGLIACNGRMAAALYDRHVYPRLGAERQRLLRVILPSTSPANASVPYEEKLRRWEPPLRRALEAPRLRNLTS